MSLIYTRFAANTDLPDIMHIINHLNKVAYFYA